MPNEKDKNLSKGDRRKKILDDLVQSKKKLDEGGNQEAELNAFLNEFKGIEYLWKNVEKKKNAKKADLREAENELVEATTKLGEVIGNLNEDNKKEDYSAIVKKAYGNNPNGAKKFIEKFPNWSIAIGTMFSGSPHYQRIYQSTKNERSYKDITSESDFELKRTGKGKIKGDGILNKLKSGWKSLKTAFSNYIKPDDIGKASKSALARRIKKFGEEINRPWRMWWDFAAGDNNKLSKDEAKNFLNKALNGSAPNEAVVKLFNYGPVQEVLGKHKFGFTLDKEGKYYGCRGFKYMNTVFNDLDNKLLTKVNMLFGVSAKEAEKNIKDSTKIKASEIFQNVNRKPEDYEKFFDILGIKEYCDGKNDEEIINKITELLKEIEGEEKAKKLVGEGNANIIKFLQLAQANYVIKNNKMKEKSEIVGNLNRIKIIFRISVADIKEETLLNKDENGNALSQSTETIIDEIEESWDKEIAKKFMDAINNILAPTENQNDNIKKVEDALKKITDDVTSKQAKLTTKEDVENAINAIKTCRDLTDETNKNKCYYNAKNGRKQFLAEVAVRLGVRGITKDNIQKTLLKSEKNLEPPYENMTGAKLVQKLRNLIGYGLGYGTNAFKGFFTGNNAESLPDLDDNNIVDTICKKLKIEIEKKK